MRTHARFPEVAAGDGHYESFYVKAAHPSEPRAVWIRHTIWKAPGEQRVGSLWCTQVDGSWGRPVASRPTVPEPEAPLGEYVLIGGAAFAPGVSSEPHWKLTYEG